MTSAWRFVPVLAALALGAACGEQLPDELAPEFPTGSGQPAGGGPPYPDGPYGVSVGSVLPNVQLVGFPDPTERDGGMEPVQLADFYNPTGADTRPKALAVVDGAVWCGPCNAEAQMVLPGKHALYAPMGGEFLDVLQDGPTPGKPATVTNLTSWVNKYNVDFPATLDPGYQWREYVTQDAYPAEFIVRTRDMKLVYIQPGITDDAFWMVFEKVLNGQPVLPGD